MKGGGASPAGDADGPAGDPVAAWRWLILSHAAVLRAIERDLARKGTIPLTWYDVLLVLNAAPDRRLRMTDLADGVVLSRTRVSRVVDELARAGLVERVPDPADRRSAFAVLTTAGRRELRRAAPHYLDGIDRHFTSLLSGDERAVIAAALERVARHHHYRQR